jgi:ABC-2 type transport system ATP-binding protein
MLNKPDLLIISIAYLHIRMPRQLSNPAIIQITQLKHSFGKQQVIDGFDLDVRQTDIYGFLGRNGAGKTTIIEIVMGLINADEGKVQLFNSNANPITLSQKSRIGYVPQDQNFYSWMTANQLAEFVGAFYPVWDHSYFKDCLKSFDIDPNKKVEHLSGGTKVKLSLALAMAHQPELLILDEPTAGLDAIARREFLDIVRNLSHQNEVTLFFSSHLVHEIEEVSNRIGIIDNGQCCFQGAPEFLKKSVRQLIPDQYIGKRTPFSIL